jgi:nucleoside-diphosphate-sugar epimerase
MAEYNILVIGANGQLGTELTAALAALYGRDCVIASDLRKPDAVDFQFEQLNVLDKDRLRQLVEQYHIQEIYLLAALLSAKGEQNPALAWQINMDGLLHVLDLAREGLIKKIFWPSSIAVFGATTPKERTPQETITSPETMYGITKLAGERLCAYYAGKFGVDVRSLRYPGLIGYKALPGGGTTDFAVDIYHKALEGNSYTCFLRENTFLPLMYMPDAIQATLQLMQAPEEKITVRSSYNIAGFSASPGTIANTIREVLPDFSITFQPDFRQQIADTWPNSIDDSQAKADWQWQCQHDLQAMTKHMLQNLAQLKQLPPVVI